MSEKTEEKPVCPDCKNTGWATPMQGMPAIPCSCEAGEVIRDARRHSKYKTI